MPGEGPAWRCTGDILAHAAFDVVVYRTSRVGASAAAVLHAHFLLTLLFLMFEEESLSRVEGGA